MWSGPEANRGDQSLAPHRAQTPQPFSWNVDAGGEESQLVTAFPGLDDEIMGLNELSFGMSVDDVNDMMFEQGILGLPHEEPMQLVHDPMTVSSFTLVHEVPVVPKRSTSLRTMQEVFEPQPASTYGPIVGRNPRAAGGEESHLLPGVASMNSGPWGVLATSGGEESYPLQADVPMLREQRGTALGRSEESYPPLLVEPRSEELRNGRRRGARNRTRRALTTPASKAQR